MKKIYCCFVFFVCFLISEMAGAGVIFRLNYDVGVQNPAPNPYPGGAGDIIPAGSSNQVFANTGIVASDGYQGGQALDQHLGANWPNVQGYEFSNLPDNTTNGYFAANNFTIETLVKFNFTPSSQGVSDESHIWSGEKADNVYMRLYVNQTNGVLHLDSGSYGQGNITSSSTVTTGQWYHVAVVYRGSGDANQNVELWINGALDATGGYPGTWETQSIFRIDKRFLVGTIDGTPTGIRKNFQGQMDAIAISDTALDSESFVLPRTAFIPPEGTVIVIQ